METEIKSVKTKKNSIIKEFIIEKYGSISQFTRKEKVPRGDVEIILHKADIFNEMNIGMKVCKALEIDAEELFCRGNIRTTDVSAVPADASNLSNFSKNLSGNNPGGINSGINGSMREDMPSDEIIREKCLKLGGAEQRKILDFINNILAN